MATGFWQKSVFQAQSFKYFDDYSFTTFLKERSIRKAITGNTGFISFVKNPLGLGLRVQGYTGLIDGVLHTPKTPVKFSSGSEPHGSGPSLGETENTCCFMLAAGVYKINVSKFNLKCGYGQRSDCKKASLTQ